ncbi:hypothetical protein LZ32DRAFT_326920 [Colletotrichum eremochloae]|nr:hypothetical protein LZ32DRAFT_326920 [Colletotrichum eremochloae]
MAVTIGIEREPCKNRRIYTAAAQTQGMRGTLRRAVSETLLSSLALCPKDALIVDERCSAGIGGSLAPGRGQRHLASVMVRWHVINQPPTCMARRPSQQVAYRGSILFSSHIPCERIDRDKKTDEKKRRKKVKKSQCYCYRCREAWVEKSLLELDGNHGWLTETGGGRFETR